jgi:hypothetical protein
VDTNVSEEHIAYIFRTEFKSFCSFETLLPTYKSTPRPSSALEMEALCSSEMLAPTYRSTASKPRRPQWIQNKLCHLKQIRIGYTASHILIGIKHVMGAVSCVYGRMTSEPYNCMCGFVWV